MPTTQIVATSTTTGATPTSQSQPEESAPSNAPPPVSPGAPQSQTNANAPAPVSTTSPSAPTTQPERGEAASSPNTSAGYASTAASTQANVPPRAPATPTRTATARPSAPLATQPTTAAGSAQAGTSDTTVQLPAAPLVGEQAGAAPAATAAPTLATGVGMQDMIDSIRATIEVAARQGITQARIALQPEALGEIRIHLSQTSDGLLARVTADTPAAAQLLAGSRAELHHSLSSLGMSLLRLDIGSSGQSDVGGREGRFPGRSDASAANSSTQAEDRENGLDTTLGLEGAQPPAGPARGELVDVLA
jgi:flagellar hook-length control protein FliK